MNHAEYFGFRQDRGQAFGLPCADSVHRLDLLAEDFLVEEQQCTQGLILRRRCDMALYGQMGEKHLDFFPPHLCGVAFLMKQNKTLRPIDVGIFSTDGVMLRLQDFPQPVE